MKTLQRSVLFLSFYLVVGTAFGETPEERRDRLEADVVAACPANSEDVRLEIETNVTIATIWGDAADEQAFIDHFNANSSITNGVPSEFELNEVLQSVDAIHLHCNAFRLVFLQNLIERDEEDATASAGASGGLQAAMDFTAGRWLTGDVRVTARQEPAHNWLFLVGQTIGAEGSGAQMEGAEFEELFNLAKSWAPNQNDEVWDSADTTKNKVTLPDMRGRGLYGSNVMAQPSITVGNSTGISEADQIGNSIGDAGQALTVAQMPSHTHAMSNAGNHGHTLGTVGNHVHGMSNDTHGHSMGYAGTHQHNSKQALYGPGNYGWGTFSDKWPTGGIRPNSDGGNSATLTNAVLAAGNHKHSLGNDTHKHTGYGAGSHGHSLAAGGNHAHSNASTGGSQPVKTVSPGVVFNVEMKY